MVIAQRLFEHAGVVGVCQGLGLARAGGIDQGGVQRDVESDHRPFESGRGLAGDVGEQQGEGGEREADGHQAVNAEPPLGTVAAPEPPRRRIGAAVAGAARASPQS